MRAETYRSTSRESGTYYCWIVALLLGSFILSKGPHTFLQWARHGLPQTESARSATDGRETDAYEELDERLDQEEQSSLNTQIVVYSSIGAAMFGGGVLATCLAIFAVGPRPPLIVIAVICVLWFAWAWISASSPPTRALPPIFLGELRIRWLAELAGGRGNPSS